MEVYKIIIREHINLKIKFRFLAQHYENSIQINGLYNGKMKTKWEGRFF